MSAGAISSQPSVVVYVNGSSQADSTPDGPEQSIKHLSAPAAPFDPHKVHREFPERWRAYVRAHYRDYRHVMQVFPVSERTARKWWDGETGANGGNVAVAILTHPTTAPAMLFAAE